MDRAAEARSRVFSNSARCVAGSAGFELKMDVLTIVKRSPFVVPLACLATATMVFISEASYWQAAGTLDSLGTMATARIHIQGLERNILNAEAGRRAYRLSGGDSEARAPYDNAIIDIDESLGFLQRHFVPDSAAGVVVNRLSGFDRGHASELARSMHILEAGPRKTSAEINRNAIDKERNRCHPRAQHRAVGG